MFKRTKMLRRVELFLFKRLQRNRERGFFLTLPVTWVLVKIFFDTA
jgi:hypothetical protein